MDCIVVSHLDPRGTAIITTSVQDWLDHPFAGDEMVEVEEYTGRTWGERLFSLPWRPLHNVRVRRFTGRVISGYMMGEDTVSLQVEIEDTQQTFTARREV